MPEKIPLNTIVLSRDSGKKDEKGQPIFARLSPPVGKSFEFTKEEIDDIQSSNPLALRDPKDESKVAKEISEIADDAMQKAKALPMGGSAAGDAANVAVTAAKGRKAQKTAGAPTSEGDAMIPEDDDTL